MEALALAREAKEALESKKAENITILDVRGISSITDYYIIATGNNTPHLKALAQELSRKMKSAGNRHYRTAGTAESEWVVSDFFDVVVHIFTPSAREYYDLERLWGDAKRVEDGMVNG